MIYGLKKKKQELLFLLREEEKKEQPKVITIRILKRKIAGLNKQINFNKSKVK